MFGATVRADLVKPLPVVLREHAVRFADKVAFSDDQRAVTYGELDSRTRRLAGHLIDMGLQRGDRVAICLGNCASMVESYLAVVRAGGIGVPVNPQSTTAELTYVMADSGARFLVTEAGHLAAFDSARSSATTLLAARASGGAMVSGSVAAGCHSYDRLAVTEPTSPAPDDLDLDDVAWMFYTSGTTGRPKGVLSTQRNCLWSVASSYVPIPGLSDQDRVLWPLPLFHSLSTSRVCSR